MAAVVAPLFAKIGASALFTTLGQVASIAGPVLGVASAIKGNQAAKAQSAEYSREAREIRVNASIAAERQRRTARIAQSRDRTAMAEGGALSGTAFGVLDQNAVAQELDALTVAYQGEQQARGADFRAAEARKSASPLNIFTAAISGFNQIDPLNFAPRGGAGAQQVY